jgi:hypothetical protein
VFTVTLSSPARLSSGKVARKQGLETTNKATADDKSSTVEAAVEAAVSQQSSQHEERERATVPTTAACVFVFTVVV